MALLLDTHALLYWLDGDRRLRPGLRRRIQDERDVMVSAVSVMEITTKVRIGKLPGALAVAAAVSGQGFVPIDITWAHAQRAGAMEWPHRDPFDRLLAATALIESMPLVSSDEVFDAIGVERVW